MTTAIYQCAMYSTTVEVGDVNPDGEANYDGYCRQMAKVINGSSSEPIDFPKYTGEEPFNLMCFALLNVHDEVVSVKLATEDMVS